MVSVSWLSFEIILNGGVLMRCLIVFALLTCSAFADAGLQDDWS
jgi:hypothetical protein